MGGDLTAALFSGPELRGGGPGPLVQRCEPDIVVGHGLGDLAALAAAQVLDPRGELTACLPAPVPWCQTIRALSAAGAARYVEAGRDHALGELVLETLAAGEAADARSDLLNAH